MPSISHWSLNQVISQQPDDASEPWPWRGSPGWRVCGPAKGFARLESSILKLKGLVNEGKAVFSRLFVYTEGQAHQQPLKQERHSRFTRPMKRRGRVETSVDAGDCFIWRHLSSFGRPSRIWGGCFSVLFFHLWLKLEWLLHWTSASLWINRS